MKRERVTALMLGGGVLLAVVALFLPVMAHEGHDKTPSAASSDPNAPKKVSPETAKLIGLKTQEIDFGKLEEVVRLTGIVTALPDRVQAVAPRTAGIVRRVTVQPGDAVKRGDLLVEIDSPELGRNWYEVQKLEADYASLQASFKRAESSVQSLALEAPAAQKHAELSEAEVARLEKSGDAVAINLFNERKAAAIRLRTEAGLKELALSQSHQEVESLKTQVESVRRSITALRALVEPMASAEAGPASTSEAPSQPSLVRLYAAIDGVVTSRHAIIGQGVTAGQTLLTLGDYAQVQVEGELPESLVDRLQGINDAPVRIRKTPEGQVITTGKVRFIAPAVDPVKRTSRVIVVADNPEGMLREGAFVDLAVVVKELDSAVVVPTSAVLKDGPARYVFVQDGEMYVRHEIVPGYHDDRVVEVEDGLIPGDVVVTQGAYSLSQLRGVSIGGAARKPAESGDGHGHSHE